MSVPGVVDPVWDTAGDNQYAWHGISVACAGDVNGDGYDDVIVGAAGYSDPHGYEGRACVYLGSASGLETTDVWDDQGFYTPGSGGSWSCECATGYVDGGTFECDACDTGYELMGRDCVLIADGECGTDTCGDGTCIVYTDPSDADLTRQDDPIADLGAARDSGLR